MFRSGSATAALALLALGQAVRAQSAVFAGPPGGEVEVEADRIVYQWEPRIVRLEGHVVARRGPALLRAGSGTLDREHGILKLEGGVLGVQGRQVFLADSAVVDLDARTAEMSNAVLFLKDRPANPDAPRSFPNALTLHGGRVRELPGGRYLAEKVTLTPCDCPKDPDYELRADTAEIDGDRAHLRGVDLQLLGLTLPLFPLSLPLTSRQSGLLAPQFGFGGPIGFTYAQPVFFTLGPSHDLTIAPGWYTGGGDHLVSPGLRSIKGPRLGLEWRYFPVTGTAGSVALDLYYDQDRHDRDPARPDAPGERGYGGVRGMAHVAHRTEVGAATFAIQGIAASDVMALRDQSAQSIENTFDLFTSDVGFWRSAGPITVGADATLMQDMRLTGSIDRTLFGRGAGRTFQRLPAVFAQIAPVPLGPGTFALEASAVQYVRLGEPDPFERATGFGETDRATLPATPPASTADFSRAPVLRLDLSPRLAVAGPQASPVALRAEAGARVDGWIAEGYPDRSRARAYGLIGGSASLPLERRYGGALHRIEPRLELRALSRPLQGGGQPFGDLTDEGGETFHSNPDAAQQGLPGTFTQQIDGGVPASRRAYDEIDFAAPASGAVEATASLSQSLWQKRGHVPRRMASFDLLQDFLLWAGGGRGRVGEGSAAAAVQLGPASVDGSVRYDWALRAISAFSVSAGVRDSRNDEVHATFGMLRGSSSERLRGGIDELFSAARFAVTPSALTGGARVGGSAALPFNLRVAYDLSWTPGDTPEGFANLVHASTLTLETPCRCAGVGLAVNVPFHDGHLLRSPAFSLRIDLKSLGSFSPF